MSIAMVIFIGLRFKSIYLKSDGKYSIAKRSAGRPETANILISSLEAGSTSYGILWFLA